MTTTSEVLTSQPNDHDLVLRLAASAYLGRYTGISRMHTESDLRLFFAWCAEQHPAPLAAGRVQIERYVRWMQEVRRFKPSTVSRRMAVVTGFYRTCVIDAVLEHSPADYLRRPFVPAESPTLGLSHLQFEALLSAARESPNVFDFALVTMLGLLGLRIFEACGANITDLGEEHATACYECSGKGRRSCSCPCRPRSGVRWIARSVTATVAQSCSTGGGREWTGTAQPAGYVGWLRCRWCGCRGCIRTCCDTPSSPPCSTPA
jgi:site-specific recombinase XerC